jgi:uncharacterized phage-associated protein
MERRMERGMLRATERRLGQEMQAWSEPLSARLKLHWSEHVKVDARLRRLVQAVLRVTGRALVHGLEQMMRHRGPWREHTEERAEVRRQKRE